jgi:GT2 family glycosyltransferase
MIAGGGPTASSSRSLAAESAARIPPGEPDVTVVIPVFNQWRATQRCLRALFACDPDVALQVVVVDDASNDETPAKLPHLPGVEVLRNGTNCGFVHSCNRGAAVARGRYVLFLNNDTEVQYGALRALVRRIERDDRIGIVGSKLVYPDGRLQEAGNIVWTDATGWNYGRLDDPQKSEYNFARDVDYVSGASLLIRTAEFAEIGGFDSRFAPGYYEDADLCFTMRERGRRVAYEPTSVVIHHEGLTSGTDMSSGMKRFQALNQAKFIEKWGAILNRDHLPSNPANVYRAARLRHRAEPALLIADSYVPLYDKEAGSNRLKRLVEGLRDAGLRIVFLPDNLVKMSPYTEQLQSDGIEVIYSPPGRPGSWRDLLQETLPTIDAAWICRPELCSKYLPLIREHSRIPIIYDTIDLHYLRLRRQSELEANDDQTWRMSERLELACAHAADRTIVVSDYEAELLRGAGVADVAIVPTIHDVETSRTPGYSKTSGILFIGGYNHTPNVDAAIWLVRKIMPLVWSQLPDVTVTLVGSNAPASVYALAGERVKVPGFVTDHELAILFRAARVFAAPLRFGAGLKGKIGQALAFGTPIVSTPVGVEGFHLSAGADALVAADARAFATAIVRLYGDAQLWTQLSERSAAVLAPFSSTRTVADALGVVSAAILSGKAAVAAAGAPAALEPNDDTLEAQLRVLRKREAELFLTHRQSVAQAHERLEQAHERLEHAHARLEHAHARIAELEAADVKQVSSDESVLLLAVISTLRRALDAAMAASAVGGVAPAPPRRSLGARAASSGRSAVSRLGLALRRTSGRRGA